LPRFFQPLLSNPAFFLWSARHLVGSHLSRIFVFATWRMCFLVFFLEPRGLCNKVHLPFLSRLSSSPGSRNENPALVFFSDGQVSCFFPCRFPLPSWRCVICPLPSACDVYLIPPFPLHPEKRQTSVLDLQSSATCAFRLSAFSFELLAGFCTSHSVFGAPCFFRPRVRNCFILCSHLPTTISFACSRPPAVEAR